MFRSLPIWLLATTALAELRQFQLVLTWKSGAPDGYQRDMIYVNGQYPGPKIEVNQGDWVVIDVINRMPYNTTIHYHGNISPLKTLKFNEMLTVSRYCST